MLQDLAQQYSSTDAFSQVSQTRDVVLAIYMFTWIISSSKLNSLPSSVVERVTSNDEVVSSILAEGNHHYLFAYDGRIVGTSAFLLLCGNEWVYRGISEQS